MKTVVMRLEGPLQSWSNHVGFREHFGIRETEAEPSKSGVLGMVACALGMPRWDTERLRSLRELAMSVRVDREGSLLEDYHTVGGGTFRGKPHAVYGVDTVVVTRRFYLADASFVVALEGKDAIAEEVARALQNPYWPVYLGRRSCVPAVPVFVKTTSSGHALAVLEEPAHPRQTHPKVRVLSEVRENDLAQGSGVIKDDVPSSFLSKETYGRRLVKTTYATLAEGPRK